MSFHYKLLAIAIAAAQVPFVYAQQATLDTVVVTAPAASAVLTVTTDTKAPRQPIPAQDGADLLKNIPGFAVTRKGGTDGDPLFRGMAASRLSILLDGEMILGGCGNRMDPPTAYIFPEAFDSVTILKGPQSVKHSGGASAGTILFERVQPDFSDKPIHGYVSASGGSYGRNDQVAQIQAGGRQGYIHLNGNRSAADNYQDGNGTEVHSEYNRWSTNAALGWTPSADTLFELNVANSDGEAAYGDRGMDGSKFARSNIGLRYEHNNLSPLLNKISARLYRNYVDHIMDNYSLRQPTTAMKMASNPDRETIGGNVTIALTPNEHWRFDLGFDHQQNKHTTRNASSMMGTPSLNGVARMEDMNFSSSGIFLEANRHLDGDHSLHLGARMNYDQAEDTRAAKSTYLATDSHWLSSGFIRYEHQQTEHTRLYAGVGHSQRAADYWERTRNPTAALTTDSTFFVNPERTTQLDIGALHKQDRIEASMSAFIAQHHDYILIESLTANATNARNIRALTLGGEAELQWRATDNIKTLSALSWVYGENQSDNHALGQMPAPELRLGLTYEKNTWSTGVLWRGVAEQNRVAINEGNIVSQDIGPSTAYGVWSVHGSWNALANLVLSAGVDNLFDKNYAEHISRSGAMVSGFETTTRINEPGRMLWLKTQWQF